MERLEPGRGVTGGGRKVKHEMDRARRDGTGGKEKLEIRMREGCIKTKTNPINWIGWLTD